MLFARREPATWQETLRIALWPRRSWSRSTRYVWLRVKRLRGSPRAVAYGFACGAFISCTPYVGFHFLLAGILAALGRGSIIASAFGTFVGNPLTFPFIWVSTYQLGSAILGTDGRFNADQLRDGFETLWRAVQALSSDVLYVAFDMLWPLIKPMTIGAIPIGLSVALLCYFIVQRAVTASQRAGQAADHENFGEAVPARP